MLFNSYPFLFVYLPLTLLVFLVLRRWHRSLAIAGLFLASLIFYGVWNPRDVLLLLASILFNFWIGQRLQQPQGTLTQTRRRLWLQLGIGVDLGLLGYFKYAGFASETLGSLLGLHFDLPPIILPLGISFFTFTQIAFLVDAYRGEVREGRFLDYGLFVTYFPHLIAGPVLHHKEMMPQFRSPALSRFQWEDFSVGATLFTMGLFKKVVFADGIAPFARAVFDGSSETPGLFEAWGGALAFTFQLYFDFSGYSDMAIGLSRLFGVRLPVNFDSPYQARNIIDFWRRWHMTLSRFLRDYLYFSLGGNRKGPFRRHLNLWLTMVLGGLWHGAGWTYLAWGALHGVYLIINHGFQHWAKDRFDPDQLRVPGQILTFLCVVLGWVLFRSPDLETAGHLYRGMLGLNGLSIPESLIPEGARLPLLNLGLSVEEPLAFAPLSGHTFTLVLWILGLSSIAFLLPNSQTLLSRYRPTLSEPQVPSRSFLFEPKPLPLVLTVAAFLYGLTAMGSVSEFLYFQF